MKIQLWMTMFTSRWVWLFGYLRRHGDTSHTMSRTSGDVLYNKTRYEQCYKQHRDRLETNETTLEMIWNGVTSKVRKANYNTRTYTKEKLSVYITMHVLNIYLKCSLRCSVSGDSPCSQLATSCSSCARDRSRNGRDHWSLTICQWKKKINKTLSCSYSGDGLGSRNEKPY